MSIREWITNTETWTAAFAGALGGVVRWVTLRADWREGVGAIIVGSICALYLGPLVEPLLEPVVGAIAPQSDSTGFSGFIVGLGGISLTGWLLERMFPPKKGGSDDAT